MDHWDWDRSFDGMKRVIGGPYVLASDVRKIFEEVEAAESLLSESPRSTTAIDAALLSLRRTIGEFES